MDFILPLLEDLGMGFVEIGAAFLEHPDRFDVMETDAKELTDRVAARFMAGMLEHMDDLIRESSARKDKYDVQRRRERTLITTAGDVRFCRTLYKSKEDGRTQCLLDAQVKLTPHERFSPVAEAKVLSEAEVHSYQHAANAMKVGDQTISKVAVMEKVHGIRNVIPKDDVSEGIKKKTVKYLHIEADEDHIHEQKGEKENAGSFMGKLVYLFEGKEDVCEGRRRLISPHYHGGLYAGHAENAVLWREVQRYIETHYDIDALQQVYISGDGASWIKAGVDYVDKSVFVADRFHLMKYINRIARLMLDDEKWVKQRFYKYIYKNNLLAAKKMLTRIQNSCDNDAVVEEVRSYLINNWEAIHRAFRDKNVLGCSAEGHVSNVYSERMSSRPMGWSEVGCDAMCRLRCYVRNHGSEKIIELVRYRRELEMQDYLATGTEDVIPIQAPRKKYTKAQMISAEYEERMRVKIGGQTVKKTLAIRERISNI